MGHKEGQREEAMSNKARVLAFVVLAQVSLFLLWSHIRTFTTVQEEEEEEEVPPEKEKKEEEENEEGRRSDEQKEDDHLRRWLLGREADFNWKGVPECAVAHLREWTVQQVVRPFGGEAPPFPEAANATQQPARTVKAMVSSLERPPEKWNISAVGYGTRRLYVVAYNKMRHRQADLRRELAPYHVVEAGLVEWWEAPHLDVARVFNGSGGGGAGDGVIKCFWPNRKPGDALSKKEMSLFLKHASTYYHAVVFNLTPVTIFEDDARINKNVKYWPEAINAAPSGWGMITVGGGWGIHGRTPHGSHLSQKYPGGRGGHGYIVSSIGAMQILRGTSVPVASSAHSYSL